MEKTKKSIGLCVCSQLNSEAFAGHAFSDTAICLEFPSSFFFLKNKTLKKDVVVVRIFNATRHPRHIEAAARNINPVFLFIYLSIFLHITILLVCATKCF